MGFVDYTAISPSLVMIEAVVNVKLGISTWPKALK